MGQRAEISDGFLLGFDSFMFGVFIDRWCHGFIEMDKLGHPATDDGEITFIYGALAPLVGNQAGHFLAQGKSQNTGCGFIQTMYRVYPLPQLITQQLQGETGFMAVNFAAVYQQAAGFVDNDKFVIEVKNIEIHCMPGVITGPRIKRGTLPYVLQCG